MRLIDADKLIDEIEKRAEGHGDFDPLYIPTVCDIEDIINQAPTVDLWNYPSKGELPTESGNYLVILELEHSPNCWARHISFYNRKMKCFVTTLKVVAWMPLPDLPKEEE